MKWCFSFSVGDLVIISTGSLVAGTGTASVGDCLAVSIGSTEIGNGLAVSIGYFVTTSFFHQWNPLKKRFGIGGCS